MSAIKAGIAGATGNQGGSFIKWLRKIPTEVSITALCDTRIEKLKSISAGLDHPALYTDFTAMLKNADIDMVVIATPDYLHCPMVLEAAQAKKNIICEKPLGLDLQKAKKMNESALKSGIGNAINFQHRYVPAMKELKRLIDTGFFGGIVAFNGRVNVPLPDLMPITWRQKKETSAGGAITDCGTHLIDFASWIFGCLPEKVIAFNGIAVKQRPIVPWLGLAEAWEWGIKHKNDLIGDIKMVDVETPDYSQLMLEFPQHRLAVIRAEETEMLARIGPYITVEVHGEKATGVCEIDWNMQGLGCLRIYTPGTSNPKKINFPELNMDDWMADVMKKAVSAIKTRAEGKFHTFPSFKDGLNVQKVLHAVFKSIEESRWIYL